MVYSRHEGTRRKPHSEADKGGGKEARAMGGSRLCPGMARDATRQEGETDPDANTEPGRPWRSIGVQVDLL